MFCYRPATTIVTTSMDGVYAPNLRDVGIYYQSPTRKISDMILLAV